jgi:two-component system osmolarity sensor histidine kinase EnvZ
MRMLFPVLRSLFSRILFTIAVVSVIFQLFTAWVIGQLLLLPVGQRSAADLAALMVHTADTWQQRPVAERARYAGDVWHLHRLHVGTVDKSLPYSTSLLPYLYFLEGELQTLSGQTLSLRMSHQGEDDWFWADLPVRGEVVRLGFSRSRIGVHPPFAMFLVLSVGGLVILGTAVWLARRLSRPLEHLAAAAQHIGSGHWPAPLPEQGPQELAALARSFNHMGQQVRELLANRTTLLAGISHDLRTPLARIQLALAMLPEHTEPELVQGMQSDLEEMNRLIGQFLEISRGLGEAKLEWVDVREAVRELSDNARRGGAVVHWRDAGSCRIQLHKLALCRIVANLLENAVRYGAGNPVDVEYGWDEHGLTLTIMDRGPGIPAEAREAVFRPFYRLEQSRSAQTGGSGLGLAIARQLAEANQWTIELLPRDGGGTVAEVRIPFGSHM